MTPREAAEQVVKGLGKAGFEAFLVGGCVRDLILDRIPHDWDITTNARPEQVMEVFPKTIPVGAAFGVVTVVIEDAQIQVATFRSDGDYADGRHPEIVFYSDTAEQDVSRRDFTMNGLLMRPTGEWDPAAVVFPPDRLVELPGETSGYAMVVDYVGGYEDIMNSMVRCIGDADKRFREDALRMLRACRFAAQLEFGVCLDTRMAIARNAPLIRQVSAERITAELLRIVSSPRPDLGLALLAITGLLDYLPITEAVKPSLANAMQRLSSFPTTDQDMGMAMLLAGAGPFGVNNEHLCRALKLPSERINAICGALAVRMDLIVNYYSPQSHSRFRLKRLMRTPGAMNGVALARQDILLQDILLRREEALQYMEVLDYCKSLTPEEIRPARLVTGDDLIAMGMEPGKGFRIILDAVEDLQLEGRVSTREEALEAARRMKEGVEASVGSGPNPCGEAAKTCIHQPEDEHGTDTRHE